VTDALPTRSVLVLDPAELPALRVLAAVQGVEVREVPSRGIEPVTTVTVLLLGAAVLHVIEQYRGGQLIDLRPGAREPVSRTRKVVYGTVVVIAVDGTVTVEVKEPDGLFGKLITVLPKLLPGGGDTKQVIEVVTRTYGPEVRIEARPPEGDG
jgi:hypothetical protein